MNESPELYPTLQTKPNGGQSLNFSHAVRVYYIVRRLTPLECSRLQGFPDCWELDLETPEPTEEDIAFWTEIFETHRKVVSPDVKPRTRNQIVKWLKDPYSDSASYKMWGNGMALPNMLFVISRIKEMHDNA
jgi:DNA (cytosine-5)-methyltransferase 1